MAVLFYDEVIKDNKKFVFSVEKDEQGYLVTAFSYRKFSGQPFMLMSSGAWRSDNKEGLTKLECMRSRQGKKFLRAFNQP
ncbi:hypothetical protein GQG94_004798 [Salmonella enterica]|nr:hypothetical protein [Salmonella enterica]ELK3355834.1 hypothetical protein [Salmonella enterica]